MAVLERVTERFLMSSFVDFGTGTLGSFLSFFYKKEGKSRFVIAFKIVIGLCYFSPSP